MCVYAYVCVGRDGVLPCYPFRIAGIFAVGKRSQGPRWFSPNVNICASILICKSLQRFTWYRMVHMAPGISQKPFL